MQTRSVRLKIEINGIVQGVGFRPFISRLAKEFSISGFIRNTQSGVTIEAEGLEADVNNFFNSISHKAPPLSLITGIKSCRIGLQISKTFEIISSEEEPGNKTLISPDAAICNDCLEELFDPNNRRYKYPFINCTNCGPRLTIIENIPYDRKYTTMKSFTMCDDCEKEYLDINDRRYHAQPNACSTCGPKIWYESQNFSIIVEGQDAITQCVGDLVNGMIIAVKGLGGFHLAVDAYNDAAVKRLRERKRREEKPFAVMVKNAEQLSEIVLMSEEEKKSLTAFSRPIVLLKKNNSSISKYVAPNNKRLGVLIAYTPLHHILLDEFKKYSKHQLPVLVMTSANFSEEPIEITNEGAKERLSEVADGFLLHNRDILIRADDSVTSFVNNKQRIFRRSRGFVPHPFFIIKNSFSILSVGAELKNTICLLKEDKAFLSQHIGDLTNYSAYQFFEETIGYLQKIIDHKAEYVAFDLHPDYLSTKWAREINKLPSFGIQHHHAHMAACMGEHNLKGNVIGIILDGTGYGIDNTIWGGEILIGNYTKVKRYSHLEAFPLPGGDAAIKEPWRIAVSYLYHSYDGKLPKINFLNNVDYEIIVRMLEKKINSPLTSSAGRLFDAVSVLCGGPGLIRYEAQAAIELMHKIDSLDAPPYELSNEIYKQKFIPLKQLIINVVNDVISKTPIPTISARFHKSFAQLLISKVEQVRTKTNINDVVLSGGVYQNEFLLTIMENELRRLNFNVFSHSNIPTNDGGISFGQAIIANELLKKKMQNVEFEL